uniref:Uncharacterized protein n=1 Tax=Oryza meridionalis TaxID=40149 RepID=A0A0E0EI86_9ORYZ
MAPKHHHTEDGTVTESARQPDVGVLSHWMERSDSRGVDGENPPRIYRAVACNPSSFQSPTARARGEGDGDPSASASHRDGTPPRTRELPLASDRLLRASSSSSSAAAAAAAAFSEVPAATYSTSARKFGKKGRNPSLPEEQESPLSPGERITMIASRSPDSSTTKPGYPFESHLIAQTIHNMKILNKEEIFYIQKTLDEKLGPNKLLIQFLLQELKKKKRGQEMGEGGKSARGGLRWRGEAREEGRRCDTVTQGEGARDWWGTVAARASQAEAVLEEKQIADKKYNAMILLLVSWIGYRYVYEPSKHEDLSLDELAQSKMKEILEEGHVLSSLEQELEEESTELIKGKKHITEAQRSLRE